MQQRVRQPYRGINPSSARQLPILAALHAGFPTLFGCIIHEKEEKVNTQFINIEIFISINKYQIVAGGGFVQNLSGGFHFKWGGFVGFPLEGKVK